MTFGSYLDMTTLGGLPDARAFTDSLAEELSTHAALPYLFIGSGISRRYLDLPDWPGLLKVFAEQADEDFDFHLASANGDFPAAASSISKAFHQHWWHASEYAQERSQFRSIVKDDEAALKVAVAEHIRERQDLNARTLLAGHETISAEIDLLRQAVVDGIITTNYDSLTDQIFPSFPPYVGQDELLLSDAQFIAETYKIHGSVDNPLSLVLTASDYDRNTRRNHYLAAKLLTIFAEHPVIFVGYSLTDKYIREIVDNIATAVGSSRLEELGGRIYFVEWNRDPDCEPSLESSSIVLDNGRLPIRRIEANDFSPIWQALSRLERPFPAAVLRQLRKHVFDLVTHPDPSQARETVRALPIDANGAENLRIVFGVGMFNAQDLADLSTISGRTLNRDDIFEDLLGTRSRALDASNVLSHGIPLGIRPSTTAYIPVFKYLQEEGRINSDNSVNFEGLPDIIGKLAEREIAVSPQSQSRFARTVRSKLTTPRSIKESNFKKYFKLECLVLLEPTDFDLDEMRDVLVEFFTEETTSGEVALLRRAACHYDRLKHHSAAVRSSTDTSAS